jgi:hypothetical protein
MPMGFDARSVDAVVVHGYPLDGLSAGQCEAIGQAVDRLGSGLVAVPHGDLSEERAIARSPGDLVPFTFVVGALVARAGTAAQEDATTQSATVNEALCAKAEAAFEAARPLLDPVLAAQAGAVPLGRPGLFLCAAGPHASACLSGDRDAALQRIFGEEDTAELLRELTLSAEVDPHAARLNLRGTFTLSARYR